MSNTFELPIVKSRPIVLPEIIGTVIVYPKNRLFGSWVECGTEDEDLKELYKSREWTK